MAIINKDLNYGRHLIKSFLEKSLPFDNILDIGAGSGTDLKIAHSVNPNAVRYGVDCLPVNIEYLTSLGVMPFSLNIERDKLPFDDQALDVILANQILEHTKELFWIFHEFSRTLKIGGKIVIGVPNLASLHNRLLLLCGRQPTPIQLFSAHVRGFTKSGTLKFINECFPDGYELVATGGSNFYPFPPVIANPLASIFPNSAWGLFMLLEKKREYTNEFINYPKQHALETPFYLGSKD